MNVVQMPMDSEGLIIDDNLTQWCNQYKPKFIYTIPTHHNPTGITMSHERRQELVKFAEEHNILVRIASNFIASLIYRSDRCG